MIEFDRANGHERQDRDIIEVAPSLPAVNARQQLPKKSSAKSPSQVKSQTLVHQTSGGQPIAIQVNVEQRSRASHRGSSKKTLQRTAKDPTALLPGIATTDPSSDREARIADCFDVTGTITFQDTKGKTITIPVLRKFGGSGTTPARQTDAGAIGSRPSLLSRLRATPGID